MNKSSQKISKRVLVALTFVVLTVFAVIVWKVAGSYTEHVMGVSALPTVTMFSDGKSTIYIRETNGEPIATLRMATKNPLCYVISDKCYYVMNLEQHRADNQLFPGVSLKKPGEMIWAHDEHHGVAFLVSQPYFMDDEHPRTRVLVKIQLFHIIADSWQQPTEVTVENITQS